MNAPTPTVKRALLRDMMRIRMVELEIARLYGEQEMRCPTHLCVGQEAPPVGVSRHLRRGDLVFSAHRSHGHYLAKGGDLKAMMAELYGRQTGYASGKGGSQHLVDLAVGFMGSVPILPARFRSRSGRRWEPRCAARTESWCRISAMRRSRKASSTKP